jgi:hypothetical protein
VRCLWTRHPEDVVISIVNLYNFTGKGGPAAAKKEDEKKEEITFDPIRPDHRYLMTRLSLQVVYL